MDGLSNILSVGLPMTLQFLNPGWWAVHIVAICVVGFIGFEIGKSQKAHQH